MHTRVAYTLDEEPTRLTRKLRGILTIDSDRLLIEGPHVVSLKLSDIRSLSFRRESGLFHIVLDAEPRVFFTPVLLSIGGLINIMTESRNTKVYTALWQSLRGPGRCAKCKYDLRESTAHCPKCGSVRVRPIA